MGRLITGVAGLGDRQAGATDAVTGFQSSPVEGHRGGGGAPADDWPAAMGAAVPQVTVHPLSCHGSSTAGEHGR